jgi:hypothetical protein
MWSWQQPGWIDLVDVYMEESNQTFFAVFSKDGLLYKAELSIVGQEVSVGTLTQVKEVFEPVNNSFLIQNQADGTVRWFLISCSNVLNRGSEIHSAELFDNFSRRCVEESHFPYITYYHQGEVLKMGMTDWISRDDHLLIASGLFDDSEIAKCMQEAYAKEEPGYWGASISYWPLKGKMEEISKGISVPVYRDGRLEEISILAEQHANCLFTSLYSERKVTNMDKIVEEQIRKLTGDNTALAESLISAIDGKNKTINEQGLINLQTAELDPVTPPATVPASQGTEPEDTPATTEPPVLELDEEAVKVIVEQMVKSPAFAEALKPVATLTQALTSLQASIEQKLTELSNSSAEIKTSVETRLIALEKTDDEKHEDWNKNLPRKVQLSEGYRPRAIVPDPAPESKGKLQDIAAQTLVNIK